MLIIRVNQGPHFLTLFLAALTARELFSPTNFSPASGYVTLKNLSEIRISWPPPVTLP